MRPGRLEQHVFVGFPSSEEEWHSVLEQTLSDHEIDGHLLEEIQNRKLWKTVDAAHLRNFSPSDIKAVVDTAYLNAVHDLLSRSNIPSDGTHDTTVTIEMHHMVKALKSTRPSLSIDDRRMLNSIYRPYIGAADLPDDDYAPAEEPRKLKTALR
jgi:SpoVK/Ycf46/Vps4 family AAA+-type ATPase